MQTDFPLLYREWSVLPLCTTHKSNSSFSVYPSNILEPDFRFPQSSCFPVKHPHFFNSFSYHMLWNSFPLLVAIFGINSNLHTENYIFQVGSYRVDRDNSLLPSGHSGASHTAEGQRSFAKVTSYC